MWRKIVLNINGHFFLLDHFSIIGIITPLNCEAVLKREVNKDPNRNHELNP
jgi:hypothetical protein